VDPEVIQRVRAHYEGEGGRRWRRIEEEHPRGYLEQNIVIGRRKLHDQLLAWLDEEGVRCVLDAGCGLGVLAEKMVRAGVSVTGVDLVPEFVDAARDRTGGDGSEFHAADLVRFLADGPDSPVFDAVVMTEVLEDYGEAERHELLNLVARSGTPRLLLAFHSSGPEGGDLWQRLPLGVERAIPEIELLRGIHLATPFRQRRFARIRVRNYRVHLSDLRRSA
jgi:SAM-dependent methyltransferase